MVFTVLGPPEPERDGDCELPRRHAKRVLRGDKCASQYANGSLDPLTYGGMSYNPMDASGAIGRFFKAGVRYQF